MPYSQACLSEDETDDLLYYARTGDLLELTSLCMALCAREKTSLHSLLSVAQDPYSHNTALHMAAANGYVEVLKFLLTAPPSSPQRTEDAEQLEQTEGAALLNTTNAAGNTPLHWAALNGHVECVKFLIAQGADAKIKNGAGRDVLDEAEAGERWEVGEVISRIGGTHEDTDMDIDGQEGKMAGEVGEMDGDVKEMGKEGMNGDDEVEEKVREPVEKLMVEDGMDET